MLIPQQGQPCACWKAWYASLKVHSLWSFTSFEHLYSYFLSSQQRNLILFLAFASTREIDVQGRGDPVGCYYSHFVHWILHDYLCHSGHSWQCPSLQLQWESRWRMYPLFWLFPLVFFTHLSCTQACIIVSVERIHRLACAHSWNYRCWTGNFNCDRFSRFYEQKSVNLAGRVAKTDLPTSGLGYLYRRYIIHEIVGQTIVHIFFLDPCT